MNMIIKYLEKKFSRKRRFKKLNQKKAKELIQAKMASGSRMINLGCGSKYVRDWVNIDFKSSSPDVIPYDLRQELPFTSSSCNFIYASHILEHFTRDEARIFLYECHRSLEKGGFLRIVVPDLETITRLYLHYLDAAIDCNSKVAEARHEWMTLELLDQLTREHVGGHILKYFSQSEIPEKDFAIERLGSEISRFLNNKKNLSASLSNKKTNKNSNSSLNSYIDFRETGELHKWMYDRVSLRAILDSIGFINIKQCTAKESYIHGFESFLLDTNEDGSIRKPDSLFMECMKD
jgi:predicted SAM-dependent methyltransferase